MRILCVYFKKRHSFAIELILMVSSTQSEPFKLCQKKASNLFWLITNSPEHYDPNCWRCEWRGQHSVSKRLVRLMLCLHPALMNFVRPICYPILDCLVMHTTYRFFYRNWRAAKHKNVKQTLINNENEGWPKIDRLFSFCIHKDSSQTNDKCMIYISGFGKKTTYTHAHNSFVYCWNNLRWAFSKCLATHQKWTTKFASCSEIVLMLSLWFILISFISATKFVAEQRTNSFDCSVRLHKLETTAIRFSFTEQNSLGNYITSSN